MSEADFDFADLMLITKILSLSGDLQCGLPQFTTQNVHVQPTEFLTNSRTEGLGYCFFGSETCGIMQLRARFILTKRSPNSEIDEAMRPTSTTSMPMPNTFIFSRKILLGT